MKLITCIHTTVACMQIHREQAKVLEPKTHSVIQGNWECGQDEDGCMCFSHHEPSKLWGKEQSKIRTCVWIEEDFWELGYQVSSLATRGSSHTSKHKQ